MAAHSSAITRYRNVLLIPSFLILVTNIATLYMSHRLPDDPMHLVTHLSFYSGFACFLSVLGIVGVLTKNTTLLSIFSNYLFIDAVICAVPRVLLFFIFPEMRSSICSLDSIQLWMQSQIQDEHMTDNERDTVMGNLQSQCRNVVGVVQAFVGLLAAALTVMQVYMAVKVRRFAFMMQRAEMYNDDYSQDISENEEDSAFEFTRYRDEPGRKSQEMSMIR